MLMLVKMLILVKMLMLVKILLVKVLVVMRDARRFVRPARARAARARSARTRRFLRVFLPFARRRGRKV